MKIWWKENDIEGFHNHLKPNRNMVTFELKVAVTVTVLVDCWNQLSNDPNGLEKLKISSKWWFDANKMNCKGSMLTWSQIQIWQLFG